VNALPLHRQEKDFDTYGIVLPKQNLANWMIKSANDWLLPIYQKVKEALLQETVIHCDETVVQVLREPNRKAESNSYMWLYRSCEASVPKVIFEYQETRSSSHPKRFFDGYQGYIHCDGYSGYHNLPGEITIVGCLAHARRKYDECIKSLSKEEQKTTKAWEALQFCRILFDIEERLKDRTPEERYEQRLELSQPILDAFLVWLEKTSPYVAPKSALGKAIYYTLAQWKYLKNYLLDGRLVLSNNLAERSIRPFVQGRKNWMFCNTPKGAATSAIIYSIILTAQENGLVARHYLTYLFEQLPNLSFKEDPQLLADYLPWSDKLPEWCKKETK